MRIRFHPDAESELHEASEWYGKQRKGLDDEFIFYIDEALQRIVRSPTMFPKTYKQARKAIVRRFPFVIFFETKP